LVTTTCVAEQQQEVSTVDSSQDPVQDKMTHNSCGSGQTVECGSD
jgi:hypothetical protein